jgi:xylan 1,4-beta-xylosidase
MTLMEDRRPDLPWTPVKGWPGRDNFSDTVLRPEWNFYMEPVSFDWYTVGNGELVMDLLPRKATERGGFGYIARRQQHHDFDVLTRMKFDPVADNEVAGIMAAIKHSHHIRLEIGKSNGATFATLFYVNDDVETMTGQVVLPDGSDQFVLKLEARDWDFQFYAGTSETNLLPVGGFQDARILSSEVAKGFTGSYVGMYASANGKESSTSAHFKWFEYVAK